MTAGDAIASIERWGQKDSMGQLLMSVVEGMKASDERTFQMQLKEPYGLVLQSLAKPSSNVPFIMPKRIAETPASEQIAEYVGSGPFVFAREEWEPGNKAVFTKFEGYAAKRAAELGRRRQGRQGRPGRVALDPGHADRGQRPDQRRDRPDRNACARSAADLEADESIVLDDTNRSAISTCSA